MSSTVWWSSTQVSPLQVTVRLNRPCLANNVSMWSRKPQPVEREDSPFPSRFSVREISVSPVFLVIDALRIGSFLLQKFPDSVQENIHLLPGADGDADVVLDLRLVPVAD